MKPYIAMFRMKLIAGMQYRAAAWSSIGTNLFFGFVFLMVYRAFYRSSGSEPPMSWSQLVSYMWLGQAFLSITMLWSQDADLLKSITDGNAAYELCRPYDLYSFWFVRLAAARLANVALRCLPILTVTFFLPGEFRMELPASVEVLGLFLLSMSFSLVLVSAISMFIYILTFVTLSQTGARMIIGIAAEFLMGHYIPIPLMPDWLQTVTKFFPFRYISDLPFRLYSGSIAGTEAMSQIAVQLIWIVGLTAFGKWTFGRVTRRIVIQGG